MPLSLRFALFTHSITSDWNNGNAHFLRGLARSLMRMGHDVTCWEHEQAWSRTEMLKAEGDAGSHSLRHFKDTYPELNVQYYSNNDSAIGYALDEVDVAVVHEWHSPEFVAGLLRAAKGLPCKLLFHDTHHRASSSPAQISALQIDKFHGVLAFGEALRDIYRNRFGLQRVWTFHEAADTTVFYPGSPAKTTDIVWIGNWGDDERTSELREYLIKPATLLRDVTWMVHGVRFPQEGRQALHDAGIRFGGYLPNLDAPDVYRRSKITLHIPRQQYRNTMQGIPTIRVFEALAMGIPLISAPWQDTEHLFQPGDYLTVNDSDSMVDAIRKLLGDPSMADAQALRGLETIRSAHTCVHRAQELTRICEELLS